MVAFTKSSALKFEPALLETEALNNRGPNSVGSKVWRIMDAEGPRPQRVGTITFHPYSSRYSVDRWVSDADPAYNLGYFQAGKDEQKDLKKALDLFKRNRASFQ